MNIEDLILELAYGYHYKYSAWDEKLICSFADQISKGIAFTSKQSFLALAILNRNVDKLSACVGADIGHAIKNPTYRLGIREINTSYQLTISDDITYDKIIKVKFPYVEAMVSSIKQIKSQINGIVWNSKEQVWTFALNENSICFLMEFIKGHPFHVDEEFQNYSNQITQILQNIDQYVPMLVAEKNTLKFANISSNMPNFVHENTLKTIFHARKCGVLIWDDQVEQLLNLEDIEPFIVQYLKSSPSDPAYLDCENTPISDLTTLVQYMSPCLFVLPGGSEIEKLNLVYGFLKSIGIDNNDMSVMFRLPTDSGKTFNKFVTENNLNSPITETTKVVFISSKLPKPILKSKIQFNCAINLGFGGVHYAIRNYVGSHPNLVYFLENNKQKEFKFDYM